MPRTLTTAQRRNLDRRRSEDPYIVLATFRHAALSAPLRVARNAAAVVSNGKTYEKGWFEIEMPADTSAPPRGRMTVPNIDRRISAALLPLITPIRVTLAAVLASAPDTVVEGYDFLYLRDVTGDDRVVSGTLDTWDFATAPWPALSVTQARFPGAYW